MIINLDVEFPVHGEDTAALINSALSSLEQLNHGPLPPLGPETSPPRLTAVEPDRIDGAGVVCQWRATVRYTLRREVFADELDVRGPDVETLTRELMDAITEDLARDGAQVPGERLRKAYADLSAVVPGGLHDNDQGVDEWVPAGTTDVDRDCPNPDGS